MYLPKNTSFVPAGTDLVGKLLISKQWRFDSTHRWDWDEIDSIIIFHWFHHLFLFLDLGEIDGIDSDNFFPMSAYPKYICLWQSVVLHLLEAFLSFLAAFFPNTKATNW